MSRVFKPVQIPNRKPDEATQQVGRSLGGTLKPQRLNVKVRFNFAYRNIHSQYFLEKRPCRSSNPSKGPLRAIYQITYSIF